MSEPFWCQIPRRVGAKRLLYVEAFAPVMNALFFCVISARLGFETSTVLVQTIRAKCMVGTGSGGAKRSFKIRWVQTLISRDARCNQETADHNKAPQPKHSRLVLAQEYFHFRLRPFPPPTTLPTKEQDFHSLRKKSAQPPFSFIHSSA